jgi:hypothetical protein
VHPSVTSRATMVGRAAQSGFRCTVAARPKSTAACACKARRFRSRRRSARSCLGAPAVRHCPCRLQRRQPLRHRIQSSRLLRRSRAAEQPQPMLREVPAVRFRRVRPEHRAVLRARAVQEGRLRLARPEDPRGLEVPPLPAAPSSPAALAAPVLPSGPAAPPCLAVPPAPSARPDLGIFRSLRESETQAAGRRRA